MADDELEDDDFSDKELWLVLLLFVVGFGVGYIYIGGFLPGYGCAGLFMVGGGMWKMQSKKQVSILRKVWATFLVMSGVTLGVMFLFLCLGVIFMIITGGDPDNFSLEDFLKDIF
jgi:hypothetical protein